MKASTYWMIAGALVTLLQAGLAAAQQPTVLRDPRLRDEDISGTTVTASVRRLPGGLYEYRYDLSLPASSPGEVLSFDIDVSCTLNFSAVTYPEPPYQYEREDNASGRHVPLQAYASLGPAGEVRSGGPAITAVAQVGWPLGLDPGESVVGLRILTPAPPGPREYLLTPSMFSTDIEADGSGWDYRNVAEDDPTIPWVPDFEVRGLTTGPICALPPPPEEPPPPPPSTRFAGTVFSESEAVNGLLTYSAPSRDRFHVAAGVSSVEVKIHYAADVDPKTFKVEPAWARNLFNPQPGKDETVVLPLKGKKSLFQLEARSTKDQQPRKRNELDSSFKDRDVFEIRRPPEQAPAKK